MQTSNAKVVVLSKAYDCRAVWQAQAGTGPSLYISLVPPILWYHCCTKLTSANLPEAHQQTCMRAAQTQLCSTHSCVQHTAYTCSAHACSSLLSRSPDMAVSVHFTVHAGCDELTGAVFWCCTRLAPIAKVRTLSRPANVLERGAVPTNMHCSTLTCRY